MDKWERRELAGVEESRLALEAGRFSLAAAA